MKRVSQQTVELLDKALPPPLWAETTRISGRIYSVIKVKGGNRGLRVAKERPTNPEVTAKNLLAQIIKYVRPIDQINQ